MATKSPKESPAGIKIYLGQPWYLIKTGFLILTWMVLAFHLEIVGPTMPILAANAKIDFSGMGSVLASRSAGYLVANVLGAILQNIVAKHSEGLLVCAFVLPAIVVFATPFVKSLILMCVMFFVQGASQGLTDLGGTNVIFSMWGDNAAAPLNSAHLGYGIGAVFVNLLVRPFLSEKVVPIAAKNNDGINATTPSINTIKDKSNIFIPYSITAGLCALIACGHVFFYIRALRDRKQKLEVQQVDYAAVSTNPENVGRPVEKEASSPYSPRTCGRGFFQYGLILSITFMFYIFFIGGNDQTFSKFYFTYLKYDKFQISSEAASWGIILYWLSYSVGRLIGAIASVFLSVNLCLNIVWFCGLLVAIAWLVFVWFIGLTGTSLFVLGALTGLVFAPIFPVSFGLFKQRLDVVPVLLALLLCGAALGAITFQKIAGLVMDRNPNHFPTLLCICMLMSIVFYVVSNFIYYFHQRKNLVNELTPATKNAAFTPGDFGEDEQLESHLREQEDK